MCSGNKVVDNETRNKCIVSSARLQVNEWDESETHIYIHSYGQLLSFSGDCDRTHRMGNVWKGFCSH